MRPLRRTFENAPPRQTPGRGVLLPVLSRGPWGARCLRAAARKTRRLHSGPVEGARCFERGNAALLPSSAPIGQGTGLEGCYKGGAPPCCAGVSQLAAELSAACAPPRVFAERHLGGFDLRGHGGGPEAPGTRRRIWARRPAFCARGSGWEKEAGQNAGKAGRERGKGDKIAQESCQIREKGVFL